MMPSRYTSPRSLEDAAAVAEALGIGSTACRSSRRSAALAAMLEPMFAGRPPDITEENLQARIRGVILMALSNKLGEMVLTTGNKSEMSVGYATLYGDMCGGYSVLKDVYKTDGLRARRWRNQHLPAARAARPGARDPRARDHQAALGRAARGPDRPGQPAALRRAGRDPPGPGRAGPVGARAGRARATTRRWCAGSRTCSTSPSTSAARRRPGSRSRARRSAATAATRSPTPSGDEQRPRSSRRGGATGHRPAQSGGVRRGRRKGLPAAPLTRLNDPPRPPARTGCRVLVDHARIGSVGCLKTFFRASTLAGVRQLDQVLALAPAARCRCACARRGSTSPGAASPKRRRTRRAPARRAAACRRPRCRDRCSRCARSCRSCSSWRIGLLGDLGQAGPRVGRTGSPLRADASTSARPRPAARTGARMMYSMRSIRWCRPCCCRARTREILVDLTDRNGALELVLRVVLHR